MLSMSLVLLEEKFGFGSIGFDYLGHRTLQTEKTFIGSVTFSLLSKNLDGRLSGRETEPKKRMTSFIGFRNEDSVIS